MTIMIYLKIQTGTNLQLLKNCVAHLCRGLFCSVMSHIGRLQFRKLGVSFQEHSNVVVGRHRIRVAAVSHRNRDDQALSVRVMSV